MIGTRTGGAKYSSISNNKTPTIRKPNPEIVTPLIFGNKDLFCSWGNFRIDATNAPNTGKDNHGITGFCPSSNNVLCSID